jgi:hypothetical protein
LSLHLPRGGIPIASDHAALMYIFNFFEVAKTQKPGKQPSFPGILLVEEHAVPLAEVGVATRRSKACI